MSSNASGDSVSYYIMRIHIKLDPTDACLVFTKSSSSRSDHMVSNTLGDGWSLDWWSVGGSGSTSGSKRCKAKYFRVNLTL